jgi:hypothetical protein
MKEIHSKDVKALYLKHVEKIEEQRQKFEKHRGMVEIIKKIEEEREKNDEEEEGEDKESDDYIDDETTDPTDIAAFEKEAKDKAAKALRIFNQGINIMPDDDFMNAVNSFSHKSQQKSFVAPC